MEERFMLAHGALQIPCILTTPEQGPVQRLVLGVHGLAGSAQDAIQESLAEEMTLFHSATFRFDFPAHGSNPCQELELHGCMQTLLAVAEEARRRYPQVEDLCIFATGFGAYITLLVLQQLPGKVKLVVQTPAVLMHDTLLAMLNMSRETFRVMEKVIFPLPRPLTVRYDFYEQLRRHPALPEQPEPMLILHGQQDDYIRMSDVQHLRRVNENSKLVIIPGTSHRFQEDGAWDMVLDLTRDWFSWEQVLLTDWE